MKFVSIFIALIININFALASSIEGTFSCKVKRVIVIQMEDGTPKEYSGYSGEIQKGHTLYLDYFYSPSINSFRMKGRSNDARVPFSLSGEFGKKELKNQFPGTYWVVNSDGVTQSTLSEDYIFGDGVLQKLNLKRYFKNDWHGTLTSASYDNAGIVTLDCRHPINKMDMVFDRLKRKGY